MSNHKNDKKTVKINYDLLDAIKIADLRKNEFLNNIKLLNQKIIFLNNKIEIYIKFKKEVTETSDVKKIIQIGKEFQLNLNPSPIYSNLCKQIVLTKIDKNIEITSNQINEIKHTTQQIKQDIKNIYICPNCGGSGTLIEIEHLREDGKITTLQHPKTCELCKGKGTIK